jgi:tellurite resistance protein TerC
VGVAPTARSSGAVSATTGQTHRALVSTALWVGLSLLVGVGFYFWRGHAAGTQFFAAYLVEYALSVDNLFVFLVLFRSFRVGVEQQRRLLSLGVLGALVLRAGLIWGGVALVHRFEQIFYLFGAFLIFSGLKLARAHEGPPSDSEVQEGLVLRLARKLPFVKEGSTALLLLAIEGTDLLFALDSIPAVLGLSRDTWVVYTSNACAVLGLRSLFFVLQAALEKLRYLHVALAGILVFIGGKMVGETWTGKQLPTAWSLGVVAGFLLAAMAASALSPGSPTPTEKS